jgi:hypothetical protein
MGEMSVRTGPPDFVGLGAQRAGTTWWFRTLVQHPAIRPARGNKKELHFFDPFGVRPLHELGVGRYHRLFPRRPGEVCGEWTPRYLRDVWVPPLLRRAAPDAKLLVMVRDPIERYRSGVQHRLTRTPERRPEMLAADAVERGRYAVQLDRFRRFFADEQILVLQYEKCVRDTEEEYRRTLRFLGVDDDHEPQEVDRARGTTTQLEKEGLWPDLYRGLQATFEPDVARLAELAPELDLELWPNFAHLATGDAPLAEDPWWEIHAASL